MKEQTAWSFSLGRWMGVQVRIHMFVVLFALVSVSLAWQIGEPGPGLSSVGLATAVAIGWLMALLVHEVGHFFVASHLGGDIQSVTVYPWGSDFETTSAPGWTRFFVYLAGPATNLFVAAFSSVVAIAIFDSKISPGFFNLLHPEGIMANESLVEDSLRIFIWANWFLAILNLVPAFLFDGGYMCHAFFQAIWPQRHEQQILIHCSLVTQLFAIGLLAIAVIAKTSGYSQVLPAWLGLALFGLVLMFASRAVPSGLLQPRNFQRSVMRSPSQNVSVEHYEHFAGDDQERFIEFPSFDEESDTETDESLSIWLKERQLERVEQAREREAEEEKLADDILEKVHQEGIESLSSEERELLDRVSARYRNRDREQA